MGFSPIFSREPRPPAITRTSREEHLQKPELRPGPPLWPAHWSLLCRPRWLLRSFAWLLPPDRGPPPEPPRERPAPAVPEPERRGLRKWPGRPETAPLPSARS